ncbi:hypothetical protein GCM10010289_03070 [Streptomyces violascens]|nr:hypothetical protein GCM10010289_03070 [Streptomyces violascens]
MTTLCGVTTLLTARPEPATYTAFTTPSTSTSWRRKSVIGSSKVSALMTAAWTGGPGKAMGRIARHGGNLAKGERGQS